MSFITSKGYDGEQWKLVDAQLGMGINEGTACSDFRGDVEEIVGGRAPHKPSSTGHVHTASGGDYYASVFGLKWVREED